MLPFGRLWGYAQWVNAYLADEVIAETAPCGAVRHGAECALDGLVLDLFFPSDFWCHTISCWRWIHGSRNLLTGLGLALRLQPLLSTGAGFGT